MLLVYKNKKKVDLRILIVDNRSPNDSFQILVSEFSNIPNVEVILSEKNGGYAYGNNFGLRYLEKKVYDYILISNNDIEINDNLLLFKLIKEYKKLKKPAFISPLMLINNKPSKFDSAWRLPNKKVEILRSTFLSSFLFGSFLRSLFYKIDEFKNTPVAVDCLPGSFFMGRKEIFKSINYFDEGTFLYDEETIIGEKVKALRLKNYLIPDLTYAHNASKTIDQFNSQIQKYKFLLESKIYYWTEYKKASFIFIITLKFLYKLRECELQFLKLMKIKKYV